MSKLNYKYKPQFAVVVMCESERDQENKFNELKQKGYKLKVVCV